MTFKSKLVPFFASGALMLSVAAHAQTATTPGTSSPAGDSNGSADDTMTMPMGPGDTTDGSAQTPDTNSYGTTTAPQTNSPSNTDSSGTSVSPDSDQSNE